MTSNLGIGNGSSSDDRFGLKKTIVMIVVLLVALANIFIVGKGVGIVAELFGKGKRVLAMAWRIDS